jgi:glycosyltransferase involved in cell wall biosynthesis
MKRVVVSVTNDLSTDQRVQRSIGVLEDLGLAPTFVGRLLPESPPFSATYDHHRFKLPFKRGFLFYASYNIALFFFLLRNRFDLYFSNDLDTLLPNYLVSRFYRKPLIYDSHEYFTGVPEIQSRPLVKWVWKSLERLIFPRLKHVITVNESIAQLYYSDYGFRPRVLRNIGDNFVPSEPHRQELGLDPEDVILINQGSGINVDRGMEEVVEALTLLPEHYKLLLVGKGDVIPTIKSRVAELKLESRVNFISPKPYRQMLRYTLTADLGLSLDKDSNLNYRYSLPNKVFDYIKCGLPIVGSRVVEVNKLVEHYRIGAICKDHRPETIANAILQVTKKGKNHYRQALDQAKLENNWDQEKELLKKEVITALRL